MCGLSGIVGTISHKDYDVFKNLLLFNMVRGEDSTGVGLVPRFAGSDIRTLKVLGPACDLYNHKKFDQLLHTGWYSVWMGHNRSATAGSINIRNAHPFQFENILGMHNGTIETHSRSKMDDYMQFGTDSEALVYNIQKNGVDTIIPKLEGSWTLVWYDKLKHTINMLRNEKRPLAYVFSKDERAMYFGSEVDTLAGALRRHLVEWKDKFSILPENSWLSWKIPKENEKFGEPERKHVEGYKWVSTRVNHSSYSAESTNSITRPGFLLGPKDKSPTVPTSDSRNSGTDSTKPGRPGNPTGDITKEPDYIPGLEMWKGMFPWLHLKQTRILRNSKMNSWILATWQAEKGYWNVKETRQAPKFLQFTHLDINANHSFKHVGKKKHKVIYFKGWHGQLLTRPEFEKHIACGCASCGRTDIKWGNHALFVNNNQFLCEWCSMDAPLVKSWFGHSIPPQDIQSKAIN